MSFKVLHITTSITGGAGIACNRLHKNLITNNLDSSILSLIEFNKEMNKISNKEVSITKKIISKIKRRVITNEDIHKKQEDLLKNKVKGFELFSFNKTKYKLQNSEKVKLADILVFHWTSGFLDLSFFENNTKPIIWVLHDMNPFTGGCHYSVDCTNFLSYCKQCPQLDGTENPDLSLNQQIEKKSSFSKVSVVCLSSWMLEKSQQSHIFKGNKHTLIPNTLNFNHFKPVNKNFAKDFFNLDDSKITFLFVSEDIHNKRKGFELLLNAIKLISDDKIQLACIGRSKVNDLPDSIIHLGEIHDERLLGLAYNAADAFILPSLEDNLPNVMLEALSCGTPVLSFSNGGMSDCIRNDFNGYLAHDQNADSLEELINKFIDNKTAFNQSEIAKDAREQFCSDKQFKAYMNLFNQVLNENSEN